MVLLGDRLAVFALLLLVTGIVFFLLPGGGFQGMGGILFGTGLTVFLGILTNRQQLAKEAIFDGKQRYMELYMLNYKISVSGLKRPVQEPNRTFNRLIYLDKTSPSSLNFLLASIAGLSSQKPTGCATRL